MPETCEFEPGLLHPSPGKHCLSVGTSFQGCIRQQKERDRWTWTFMCFATRLGLLAMGTPFPFWWYMHVFSYTHRFIID